MKKNRPAYRMTVVCKKEDMKELQKIIFRETYVYPEYESIKEVAIKNNIPLKEFILKIMIHYLYYHTLKDIQWEDMVEP